MYEEKIEKIINAQTQAIKDLNIDLGDMSKYRMVQKSVKRMMTEEGLPVDLLARIMTSLESACFAMR